MTDRFFQEEIERLEKAGELMEGDLEWLRNEHAMQVGPIAHENQFQFPQAGTAVLAAPDPGEEADTEEDSIPVSGEFENVDFEEDHEVIMAEARKLLGEAFAMRAGVLERKQAVAKKKGGRGKKGGGSLTAR